MTNSMQSFIYEPYYIPPVPGKHQAFLEVTWKMWRYVSWITHTYGGIFSPLQILNHTIVCYPSWKDKENTFFVATLHIVHVDKRSKYIYLNLFNRWYTAPLMTTHILSADTNHNLFSENISSNGTMRLLWQFPVVNVLYR